MALAYASALLKLSGEALAGEKGQGLDFRTVENLADQVKAVHELGVRLSLVVGGGNFVRGTTALWIMAIAWGVIMLFNLITLPVEFDASRRAKQILGGMGFIREGEEAIGVRRTLDAAGWTYVAAFVTSLAYFLWHLLPLIMGRSDE